MGDHLLDCIDLDGLLESVGGVEVDADGVDIDLDGLFDDRLGNERYGEMPF